MKLTIIRGLPGSGKSTIANSLPGVTFEADQYFINSDNQYVFDISQIGEAHRMCQRKTYDALLHGFDVNVSNTFTTPKELRPYFDMAREFNIVPTVILCQNQFQNVHNVPAETLDRMRNRFVYDISSLFEGLNDD